MTIEDTHDASIVQQVHDYVEAASLQKGSPTPQVRRVIAALRAIGLPRSSFCARVVREPDGTYGQAIGSPRYAPADQPDQKIVQHAQLLVKCGLNVHVLRPDMAFVATPRNGDQPHIVRHVAVAGTEREPLDSNLAPQLLREDRT